MALPASRCGPGVRFQPDENPGWPVTIGLALQYCLLTLGPVALTVAIVVRTAGQSELFLSWAVCAALLGERHRDHRPSQARGDASNELQLRLAVSLDGVSGCTSRSPDVSSELPGGHGDRIRESPAKTVESW